MTTYERVVDGEVVERVTPVDGSHEDTRLGVLVLDGGSEWRVEGTRPDEPAPDDETTTAPDSAAVTAEDVVPQDLPSADSAPDTNVSEEPDGAATTDGDGTGGDGDKPKRRR